MSKDSGKIERMPRREPPEFENSDKSLFGAILDDGFFNVALNDSISMALMP